MKAATRKTTARELRNHFPQVMAWVRDGESVDITFRGKEVATLVPKAEAKPKRRKFDLRAHEAWMKKVYGGKKLPGNSVLIMRENDKW